MSIKADVDRGLEIVAEVARLGEELKLIEGRLTKAALDGEQIPLEDKDREGRQWIAAGTSLRIAVIFTADSLVASFADKSAAHYRIKAAVGDSLKEMYGLTWSNRFKDGKRFRARALELFGKDAPAVVTACLALDKDGVPKSKTVVAWHEPKPLAQKEGK